MKITTAFAAMAFPLMAGAFGGAALAYDNDEQALRVRDMIADPSVPLAWDRRHHPETWRYRHHRHHRYADRCGRRAYWDGDECVLKRRWR